MTSSFQPLQSQLKNLKQADGTCPDDNDVCLDDSHSIK